ncbi:hypothetical protein M3Y94_00003800 [Aphelenchoides besseyi]|nr:hypothetical protein M3Y94_00003800 [Aphelenchoides besseyi]
MKDNKTVANCESATLCDLQITNDGKLTTHIDGVEDQEVGCDNLHKEIDNTWVWTMFRVEDLPVDYKLDVYARDVDSKEEGMEYIPPSITDTPNFSATTIKLDYVIYVLVALSVVILLSTFVVFLSSIFAACKK